MVVQQSLVISTTSRPDGRATLSLAGEIDFGNVAQLRTTLTQLIRETTSEMAVDLADVSFIDSTGLGVIIQAKNRLVERGHDLVVLNPSPRILRIFEVAGLKEYLGV